MRERSKRAFASREYGKITDCPQCSKKHRHAEYYEKLPITPQGIVPITTGGHLESVLWEFRQPNMHSEPINKALADEIMDFRDIIYRNNNYAENLRATGNNENKNIIFIQQLYIPKHTSLYLLCLTFLFHFYTEYEPRQFKYNFVINFLCLKNW